MKRSQNLSNQEKMTLRILQKNKNIDVVINDTDKNVGPACADKEDVIKDSMKKEFTTNSLKKKLNSLFEL